MTDQNFLSKVEVLNTENLQWWTASSTPEVLHFPREILCNGSLYISSDDGIVYSCSVESLLQSSDKSTSITSRNVDSVWNRLANINEDSTLATLGGHVLVIGGKCGDEPSGAVQRYNRDTNSWNVISEMPTPRYNVLAAVLPTNELMVVGGYWNLNATEIGWMK